MMEEKIYAKIDGHVVLIGFGSIGRGVLPLIERHFAFDKSRLTVIDPDGTYEEELAARGINFIRQALVRENYREILTPLLADGAGPGFCINLSIDVASLALMALCRELGALYIDSSNEPWLGFFTDKNTDYAARTTYAIREQMLAEKRAHPGTVTAVSACGANPGMVSWLTKQALLNIATDTGMKFTEPQTREEWARLMRDAGVKGLHIAERDTQKTSTLKQRGRFMNTWSVDGLICEGIQPAELGWGTHEKWMPERARRHKNGCGAAIYLLQPGANTRVYSWCPTPGPQYGLLVSHLESISIADYFTVGDPHNPEYRPTCHYAYHPCNAALLSLNEMFGGGGRPQKEHYLIDQDEIVEGKNELGVLLYGHKKNAYWYGSQLTIDQTRALLPSQNATGLQVSSGVLAGMVWALENPRAGIVEPDEMDFRRCLEVQTPYLGPVKGYYTDWNPVSGRSGFFPEDLDETDPWQFRNILMR